MLLVNVDIDEYGISKLYTDSQIDSKEKALNWCGIIVNSNIISIKYIEMRDLFTRNDEGNETGIEYDIQSIEPFIKKWIDKPINKVTIYGKFEEHKVAVSINMESYEIEIIFYNHDLPENFDKLPKKIDEYLNSINWTA